MKRFKVTGTAACCAAVFFMCGRPDAPPEPRVPGPVAAASIAGAWERDVRGGVQTFTITFLHTGRYAVKNSEQRGTVYGDWSLGGDTLTIQDTDCKDYVGKYRLSLEGDRLNFALINDDSNRPEVIPGTWFRVPEGDTRP